MTKYVAILSLILLSIGCSDDETPDPQNDNMGGDPISATATIWTGSNLAFSKADDTDPTVTTNQDRLTDNVIITRGTLGGQIFNIAVEGSSNKSASPVGTEWAIGRTSDLGNVTFAPFRTAVGEPKDVVGKNLVLHLIQDDIYLNVNFTQWTQGKAGGFAYLRATE